MTPIERARQIDAEEFRRERYNPSTIITFADEAKSITEWALDYGLTPEVIIARLNCGDKIERAITLPMTVYFTGQKLPVFHESQTHHKKRGDRGRTKWLTFNGETLGVSQWAKITGIQAGTLHHRIKLGWTPEMVLTTPLRRTALGVVSDFAGSIGTGAGRHLQESPEITFSEKAIIE